MANVLIIDDEELVCHILSDMVERAGHDASYALTLREGIDKALSAPYDVVFLDVRLPDGNGLDALPRIRKTGSSPEVIIITGAGDPNAAEIAIKNDAWDYLQKPLSTNNIILQLNRVFQYRNDLKKTNKTAVALKLDGIVGNSPQMQNCFDFIAQAAISETNVLITGETGTGKELFARAIHDNSPRSDRNFVVVDCAALPETLVESLLFGYEKGIYTGADRSREGMITQAHDGTLFLDEVGELPLSLQKTFLRVLQERRYRPVGSKHETESDFRLIATTNRNLDHMAQNGKFRNDLLYRLRSLSLELPPVRQRHEDIKALVLYYTAKICERYGIRTKGFSTNFFDVLNSYEWPGNVRELLNTLEGIIAEAYHEPTLFPRHLPNHIRIHLARRSVSEQEDMPGPYNQLKDDDRNRVESFPEYRVYKDAVLAEAEKKYFQDLMYLTKGSVKRACQISGLGRTRLYTLMKKNGISRFTKPFFDSSA